MLRVIAVGLLVSGALQGCAAMVQPANPVEFRSAVKNSSLATFESVEAARPYRQVADTLRKKANECLAVTAESSGPVFQGNMLMTEHSRSVYKPTVTETEAGMELALQVDFGSRTTPQKVPEGGFYILIADAAPAGNNATKLTIYRGSLAKAKEIDHAIRAWAKGESSSCPKLSG